MLGKLTLAAATAAILAVISSSPLSAQDAQVGVVANVRVLSDKNPVDVSSLAAWKKTFLKDSMTDHEKGLAIWKTVATFQHQDGPPVEYLQNEGMVLDPIKMFNVYGYSFCGVAASEIQALARYSGLKARGSTITAHVVPELFWDDSWHMLDASLINYFTKPDGKIASISEIQAAVKAFYDANPEVKCDDAQLRAFQQADGWTGWKKGPQLLADCKFYGADGWWPARTHGWYSTMQEYSNLPKPSFPYENGYTCGYQVNIQLRPGERITRNWFNKGLHVNMADGGGPGCMSMKVGEGNLAYSAKMFGDIAPGRVGNGLHEYDVPVGDPGLKQSAWRYENIGPGGDKNAPSLRVKDAAANGILEIRMPSSYVYLSGQFVYSADIPQGGAITAAFSDNNGLDWRPLTRGALARGEHTIDLKPYCFRRYDYILRFTLKGAGTSLDALKITHDIQHSQRPLPALSAGDNTLTFSAGPQEGTITIEGSTDDNNKGKQLLYSDFHPVLSGVQRVQGWGGLSVGATGAGDVTWTADAPGDITRLRISSFVRMRDAKDAWDIQCSFDGGKTFKSAKQLQGPFAQLGDYTEVTDVPAGTKSAMVRYVGTQSIVAMIFNSRIDADYKIPNAGFRPVQVTYVWEEGGKEIKDTHVAKTANETYKINCATAPLMKSIILELAK